MLSVIKNGKFVNDKDYTWDSSNKTFTSHLSGLEIEFDGHNATFKTGSYCKFKTGPSCIFVTGSDCKFKTGPGCVFVTGSDCTFETENNCTFVTWDRCNFKTASYCNFVTKAYCVFDTGSDCTFKTSEKCIFSTGTNCVVSRNDVFEVIELSEVRKIQLNGYMVEGFKILETRHKITIDCTKLSISEATYKDIKKLLEIDKT